MTRQLPDLDEQDFYRQALGDSADAWTPWLTPRCLEALWRHYQELRRWNRLVSLVGPGTAEEVWHRHYAESLAAVPWLAELLVAVPSESPPTVLDLGSGAGFPGFVVAAALPG
ncbi:MAG: class I SAM-dependent methyltransferase, partial [Acidobacteria bacterium]|nr:class I SAM-dependent methyltransferase [Acidobacteriota bacterium]